jgi:WD40 repeat protein
MHGFYIALHGVVSGYVQSNRSPRLASPVCRRWHAVCAGATAKQQAWQWRWAGYTHRRLTPCTLWTTGFPPATCLDVGLDGKLYTGDEDGGVGVWSTLTNTRIQTLHGHRDSVRALVVGKDGTVYTASDDLTIRLWSGEDGSHRQTLHGHTHAVMCLAVGADGTLYSGSHDKTVRVWTHPRGGSPGLCISTDNAVLSLAPSNDGKLYSRSVDKTIRMWSGLDGSPGFTRGTLEGHTDAVLAVAVGADGTVYSGSNDGTLRTWSGLDGSPIRTLQVGGIVSTIAIGAGNTVLFTDASNRIRTWNGGAAPARTLSSSMYRVWGVAIGHDGRLFVTVGHDRNISVL